MLSHVRTVNLDRNVRIKIVDNRIVEDFKVVNKNDKIVKDNFINEKNLIVLNNILVKNNLKSAKRG